MPAPRFRWDGKTFVVYRSEYRDGRIAIVVFEEGNVDDVPYGELTINGNELGYYEPSRKYLPKGYEAQFIDTWSWPGIMWVLDHDKENNWVAKLPEQFQPQNVQYPLCVFNLSKIPHI